jgi:hypothetical protein
MKYEVERKVYRWTATLRLRGQNDDNQARYDVVTVLMAKIQSIGIWRLCIQYNKISAKLISSIFRVAQSWNTYTNIYDVVSKKTKIFSISQERP